MVVSCLSYSAGLKLDLEWNADYLV